MDRDKLITDNLPFVTHIAKQYLDKGLSLDDLVSEGTIGLINAAEHYDETKTGTFISYAVWWIRQAIKQAIAEQAHAVRVPLNKAVQSSRINKARVAFIQQNERRPNINELAEHTNIPEHTVKDAIKATSKHVSVDAPLGEGARSTLLDLLPGSTANTDEQALTEALRNDLQNAILSLTQREQQVLSAFYGIGQPETTLAEIANQMGIKRERARQIRDKAIRHLRSNTKNRALRTYLSK